MLTMMCLGRYTFGLQSTAYQSLQRQTQYKHGALSRVGALDAWQTLGPGTDTITLTGVVKPPETGRIASLRELRDMADQGGDYMLVDGNGAVYGAYFIDSLNEHQRDHFGDGTPRRIDFTLVLKRSPTAPENYAASQRQGGA